MIFDGVFEYRDAEDFRQQLRLSKAEGGAELPGNLCEYSDRIKLGRTEVGAAGISVIEYFDELA